MLKTTILAFCAALVCAGAASAQPHDGWRDDAYERGHPRAPGGYERGYRYEYGDPRGPAYGAGERYEHRREYDSRYDRREVYGDRYGATGDRYYRPARPIGYSLPTYGDAAQFYGYPCASPCRGSRPAPCGCAGGELVLPGSFFYDYGGVGPYPEGGVIYGGGGYGMAFAGAHASASASAAAFASSRTSIRFGGHKGGKHHGGGKK
jgi:hypothetical protein